MSTALRLQTLEARKKLPKRSEPYWWEISRGRYIGYRRGATGGFWLLREHCQGMGKKGAYIKRRLGPADDDGAGDGVTFFEQTTAGKAEDARVFDPVTRIGLSRAMRAACGWRLDRKANDWRYDGTAGKISPPATFHDLRRSYGSLLLNSGASAEVIQELLGHADLRMTRRAYAHLLQKTLQRAVKKHLPTFGLEPSNVKPLTSSDKQGVE